MPKNPHAFDLKTIAIRDRRSPQVIFLQRERFLGADRYEFGAGRIGAVEALGVRFDFGDGALDG